jgi:hypothetical protein
MTTKKNKDQNDIIKEEGEGEEDLVPAKKNYGEGIKIMRLYNGILSEIGGEDSDEEEGEEKEE